MVRTLGSSGRIPIDLFALGVRSGTSGITVVGAGAYAQDDSADSVLEGIIEIGALIPVTGPASDHGEDIRFTVSLAEDDFNMYLEENGLDWRLNVVMEHTATSPVIAREKLSALNGKGHQRRLVGTYSSAELSNVMAYARNKNMLLISYGSVASSLALSGHKVFSDGTRLVHNSDVS